MYPTNERLAGMLREIADILEYQGVAFKPAAYRRAAQTLEDLDRDITAIDTEKELKALPGIGEAIASKIREAIETGDIHHLQELRAQVGAGSLDLMHVENLGPKRVAQLEQQLGIRTVEELIRAAEAGKLRSLPRLSELMEKKILESAKRVTERNRRFPLGDVRPEVEKLLLSIRAISGVVRAEPAGSYRRQKETIGDLDIVVTYGRAVENPDALAAVTKPIADAILALPGIGNVVAFGDTKVSFDLASGLRVDVRFVGESQWGSALLYFTGNKEHNIALRRLAIERGWKLNEYGLFEGDKVIASREEEDIYRALGLPYMEPTERTGQLPVQ